jgi:hypothetical protein
MQEDIVNTIRLIFLVGVLVVVLFYVGKVILDVYDVEINLPDIGTLVFGIILIIILIAAALFGYIAWKAEAWKWGAGMFGIAALCAFLLCWLLTGLTFAVGVGLMVFVMFLAIGHWQSGKEKEKKRKEKAARREFEESQRKKGLVKYVDRFGNEIWDKPAKIEKIRKIDEEEKIKESKLYKVVEAIEEFEPARKYGHELPYQTELRGWLKSKFPNTDIEIQRGASRPDIVIDDDIAVEVKGPTGVRELKDLSDKCVRYLRHFDNFIIVLFEVNVPEEHWGEFEEGLVERFPEVKVIRKD